VSDPIVAMAWVSPEQQARCLHEVSDCQLRRLWSGGQAANQWTNARTLQGVSGRFRLHSEIEEVHGLRRESRIRTPGSASTDSRTGQPCIGIRSQTSFTVRNQEMLDGGRAWRLWLWLTGSNSSSLAPRRSPEWEHDRNEYGGLPVKYRLLHLTNQSTPHPCPSHSSWRLSHCNWRHMAPLRCGDKLAACWEW